MSNCESKDSLCHTSVRRSDKSDDAITWLLFFSVSLSLLKKKNKAIIQKSSLPGGWTVEMSSWYSLGLHTVITDKPQVPSEGGFGHVGLNAYSKSYLVILVAFLHQSHHPLLLFYYSTFRFPSFYLAQMSDKAWAGEKFKINPCYSAWYHQECVVQFIRFAVVDFWRWDTCNICIVISILILIHGIPDGAKPWDQYHPHSKSHSSLDCGHVKWYLESSSFDYAFVGQ